MNSRSDEDRQAFVIAINGVALIFNKDISDMVIDLYFKALSRFELTDVVNSLQMSVEKCKFFPKPVELIELISGGGASLSDKSTAEACKALEAIKRHGKYKSVCFDDAVTQAVLVQVFGGWTKICTELKEEEEKWFLKDFAAAYQSFSRQNIKKTGYLSGIAETSNASQGHLNHKGNVLEIVYVGDEDKAKQIELAEKSVGNAKAIVQDIKSLTANIGVWQMKRKAFESYENFKKRRKKAQAENKRVLKRAYIIKDNSKAKEATDE